MSIRIEPEEVRGMAGQYRTQAQLVQEVNTKMDQLLGQTQSVMEGEACRAYSARFEELKPGFMRVVELIDEIAAGLDATAQTIEDADKRAAGQW